MSGTPQSKRLLALLSQHGASGATVAGSAAWAAFKEYGREVFASDGVGLLFQVGTFDFTGTALFYFDPVCQFELTDAEGEHDHFEQLHCELSRSPDEGVKDVEKNLWSFDYPTADVFFTAVEALSEFQAAIGLEYRVDVYQEEV